jgi:hypothetical protein
MNDYKNIIIVGDSYCNDSHNKTAWPVTLARILNLNLICHGDSSAHWWSSKVFLDSLPKEIKDNTEVIVFCNTYTHRVPTDNTSLNRVDLNSTDTESKDFAVKLYYKFIHNYGYSDYVEKSWFKDMKTDWSHVKLINLHCFPWSIKNKNFLGGVSVTPSLTAISLNEINSPTMNLVGDTRPNHFNQHNNIELAEQLANIINNYTIGDVKFDVSKFEQLTDKWFDWDISEYKPIY